MNLRLVINIIIVLLILKTLHTLLHTPLFIISLLLFHFQKQHLLISIRKLQLLK